MKQLEELTADIREKLPMLKNSIKAERIQDSENNCYRIFMGGIFMGTTSNNELSKYVVNHINDDEIMLNDVLEWFGENYAIYIYNFPDTGIKGLFYHTDYGMFEHAWDLSKPYLKDQSPELISFLHSLIKK
ncbi:hypothetical protein HHL23_09375 [Chryseobacterium sp. RP-3-3]|uniref:Uncharacterized protein n=1 Tax=Chryseobacterium antibioticum TaxID=2728847 RepID=A0A7Y0AMM8_9FLAO|nr:hypothetical protein [Chryseobacterium antibioticum]NML70010.1 hypothetical protein [Chryseobacterium antibioticum]